MKNEFDDAIRAAIAVQVAILEYHDSDINDQQGVKGLDDCLKALTKSIQKMKRSVI